MTCLEKNLCPEGTEWKEICSSGEPVFMCWPTSETIALAVAEGERVCRENDLARRRSGQAAVNPFQYLPRR